MTNIRNDKNFRKARDMSFSRRRNPVYIRSGPLLPFAQFAKLLPQPAESPYESSDIEEVNRPGRNVGGEKKLYSVHRALLLKGRLAFSESSAPAKDSIA